MRYAKQEESRLGVVMMCLFGVSAQRYVLGRDPPTSASKLLVVLATHYSVH